MTDKEKLQNLFDAALRAPAEPSPGPLKQTHPSSPVVRAATPAPAPAPVSVETEAPLEVAKAAAQTPVLDAAASDELGALLDERILRDKRKRKRGILVTLLVFFSITGGGFGWFVRSPDRVQAFKGTVQEVRSVGDVKSIIAKYQASLDKIGSRSTQLDQASAAMGATASPEDLADPNMDAEMKELMGGEGKTTGQRNSQVQKAFGNRAKEHGTDTKKKAALKEEDSFSFE